MGRRRHDITGFERVQIVMRSIAVQGKRDGSQKNIAEEYGISRRSVYQMKRQAEEVLRVGLKPGKPGPARRIERVLVSREHLIRSLLVLNDSGVSERKIITCLEQILGYGPSLGWVSTQLKELENRAEQVNAKWKPSIGEGLAGDEIYLNGQPNLLVVGNDSLYIYELTQQPSRDSETWGCVLWDAPDTPQFARDGGTGLQAGAKMAGKPDQLDWWHSLYPLWRIDASLERKAYDVLSQVIEREAQFNLAHTPKRLEQHLNQWEKLSQQADAAIAAYDRYHELAFEVNEGFGMIDLATGQIRHFGQAVVRLQRLGEKIKALGGEACRTLGTTLVNQGEALYAYLPRLEEAVSPLKEKWGDSAIAALCRIFQVEERTRRGHLDLPERQALDTIWSESLDRAFDLLKDTLFEAWEDLRRVLGRNWRGSNAAECVNSLLRPHFNVHKYTDQKALELRRFLHNTHTFQRGKRAGYSPAQLVGIELPEDPLVLLGLPARKNF